MVPNGKLVHRHATTFECKNLTNVGDKFFVNPDKISSQCSNVHCLEPCTIQLKQTYFFRSPLGNFKVMQVSKKFAAFIAFKTKDKMFYVFYYLTFRKCTLKQHLTQNEYVRGVSIYSKYSKQWSLWFLTCPYFNDKCYLLGNNKAYAIDIETKVGGSGKFILGTFQQQNRYPLYCRLI